MELHLEKRCISAYVENQIGVLAKISGLFAGKNYNLDTLTVGETEDPTMSRMTIELTCDDLTYEQIIKRPCNTVTCSLNNLSLTTANIHRIL